MKYIQFRILIKNAYQEVNEHELLAILSSDKLEKENTFVWISIDSGFIRVDDFIKTYKTFLNEYIAFKDQIWDFKIDQLEIKKLTFEELIETLLDVDLDKAQCRYHDLQEYLSVSRYPVISQIIISNRRRKKRFPIAGGLIVKDSMKTVAHYFKALEIGWGGVSCKSSFVVDYKRGSKVFIIVRSPQLKKSFTARGIIAGISKSKETINIEFLDMYGNGAELINDYTLRFETASANPIKSNFK